MRRSMYLGKIFCEVAHECVSKYVDSEYNISHS